MSVAFNSTLLPSRVTLSKSEPTTTKLVPVNKLTGSVAAAV